MSYKHKNPGKPQPRSDGKKGDEKLDSVGSSGVFVGFHGLVQPHFATEWYGDAGGR